MPYSITVFQRRQPGSFEKWLIGFVQEQQLSLMSPVQPAYGITRYKVSLDNTEFSVIAELEIAVTNIEEAILEIGLTQLVEPGKPVQVRGREIPAPDFARMFCRGLNQAEGKYRWGTNAPGFYHLVVAIDDQPRAVSLGEIMDKLDSTTDYEVQGKSLLGLEDDEWDSMWAGVKYQELREQLTTPLLSSLDTTVSLPTLTMPANPEPSSQIIEHLPKPILKKQAGRKSEKVAEPKAFREKLRKTWKAEQRYAKGEKYSHIALALGVGESTLREWRSMLHSKENQDILEELERRKTPENAG